MLGIHVYERMKIFILASKKYYNKTNIMVTGIFPPGKFLPEGSTPVVSPSDRKKLTRPPLVILYLFFLIGYTFFWVAREPEHLYK